MVFRFENYNEDKARHTQYLYMSVHTMLMGIECRYNADHDEHYMGYRIDGICA